jgi:hypothetical protein
MFHDNHVNASAQKLSASNSHAVVCLFFFAPAVQQLRPPTGHLCLQMTLRRITLPGIVVMQHGENKNAHNRSRRFVDLRSGHSGIGIGHAHGAQRHGGQVRQS